MSRDLYRLHAAARTAHETAWSDFGPVDWLMVIAGGIVGAMVLFGLPWVLWLLFAPVTA
jgi:hypothetical protein